MKRLWQGLAILAAVLAAAIVALHITPPSAIINNQAAKIARDLLGREVEMRGRSAVWLRPLPTVRLEDVRVPATPAGGEPLAEARAIEIDFVPAWSGYWPTLAPSVARIDTPSVRLAAGAAGRGKTAPGGTAVACTPASAGKTAARPLGTILVSNGTLLYGGTAEPIKLERINGSIVQASAASAVRASLDSQLKGERLGLRAELPGLDKLVQCAPFDGRVSVEALRGTAELRGSFDPWSAAVPSVRGASRIDVPALEDLAQWLGLQAGSLGTGKLAFAGDVSLEPATQPAAAQPVKEAVAGDGAMRVAVRNGSLSITDRTARPLHALERIEASATFAGLADPVSGAADLTYNGERFAAQGLLQSPLAVMMAERTGMTLQLSAAAGRIELGGDIQPGQPGAVTSFNGRAKGASGELRRLASVARIELPTERGFETGEVEGDVSIALESQRWVVRLQNARIVVDDTTMRGNLAVETAATRRSIGGKLAVDRIDVTRYYPELIARPQAPAAAGDAGGGQRSDGAPPLRPKHDPFAVLESASLQDALLERIAELEGTQPRKAQTEAPQAAAGWSEQPLPLGALADLDLDLDVSVGELKVDKRVFVVPSLKSQMKDGRLALEGRDIASFGGKFRADAVIDTKPASPTYRAKIDAEGVEVNQVLADLGIAEVFSGKAKVAADLTASGSTERAIMSSLSGSVRTEAERSAIVGWDLSTGWRTIVDRLRKGLGMLPRQETARTPVERVVADLAIDKGVVRTRQAATVNGPHFSASGAGQARLVAQDVDFRGTFSTFVAPPIELPFKVTGPWASVQPGIDSDRVGLVQAFRAIVSIAFARGGSGSSLESVGGGDEVDPQIVELLRRYATALEQRGGLSPAEAAEVRQLREGLGGRR